MRITLLTLAMFLGLNADYQVLMWFLALLPLTACVAAVCFMLAGQHRPPPRVWQEGERHLDPTPAVQVPAHRRSSVRPAPGRHQPGRGRYAGLSRQAQLEERTVSVTAAWLLKEDVEAFQTTQAHEHKPYRDGLRIRCETCKLDLVQPGGMPEVGAAGVHSWDRKGRPVRPSTPPPSEGRRA